MAIVLFPIVFAIQLILGSGVLAGAILLAGDEALHKESILKCLGITLAALLVALLPFVGWLSIFVWFGGVMVAFEKGFLEALLIAIACMVINFVLRLALGVLIAAVAGGAEMATGIIAF